MNDDEVGEIVGRRVRDRHGHDVGSVEEIVRDRATGRVFFAVVGRSGSGRGTSTDVLPIPWSALACSSKNAALHLSMGRVGIERAPTIGRDELGDLQHRDAVVEVFSYYGVQPPWDGARTT